MSKRSFTLLFLSPYIFIALSMIVASFLSPSIFKDIATERALRIAEYPYIFEVPEFKKTHIPDHLRAPIRIVKKEFPQVGLEALAPPPQTAPKITLLMISKDLKLAIINGIVLKEGDSFGKGRVLTINQDRVVISEMGKLKEIPVPPQ